MSLLVGLKQFTIIATTYWSLWSTLRHDTHSVSADTAPFDEGYTWYPVQFSDIGTIDDTNAVYTIDNSTNPINESITVSVTFTERGCSGCTGSAFAMLIEGDWTKLRYTSHYYGNSACWSLYGTTGLCIWGNRNDTVMQTLRTGTDLEILSNDLLVGQCYENETYWCTTDNVCNFWHSSQGSGYKGSITSQFSSGGIGVAASCLTKNTAAVTFDDIYVGYDILEPSSIPSDEPSDMPSQRPTEMPSAPFDDGYTWYPVQFSDIGTIDDTNAVYTIVNSTNSISKSITVSVTFTEYGCSGCTGSAFAMLIDGDWTKLRYTSHYYGRSACWSLYGTTGLCMWGNRNDSVIETLRTGTDLEILSNDLLVGQCYENETYWCTTDNVCNFWHASHGAGYKGSITSQFSYGGIGVAASCLTENTAGVTFDNIYVGYDIVESDSTSYSDRTEPNISGMVLVLLLLFGNFLCIVFI